MHPTARKFAGQVRDSHGFEVAIEEFPEGTKTADDVTAAVGCDVAQIIKSIVIRVGDETVAILTSGMGHVDEASLGSELDAEQGPARSANPFEVETATG